MTYTRVCVYLYTCACAVYTERAQFLLLKNVFALYLLGWPSDDLSIISNLKQLFGIKQLNVILKLGIPVSTHSNIIIRTNN